MSALDAAYLALLYKHLKDAYVAHLPPLLSQSGQAHQMEAKQISRAFSAFVLHNITGVDRAVAAGAVVDDFDDVGLDAIYYDAPSETVYLVQSKLKASEQFSQTEALAFCQGVRKLLKQDFSGFNEHVNRRRMDIEDVLDTCSAIQLVVAHTGSGVSSHAKQAVHELLIDDTHGEDRLNQTIVSFDAAMVVSGLQSEQAYKRVDATIHVEGCTSVSEPRTTYFGLANLSDLVALEAAHGKALYDKNIRTFLGKSTEVNAAIQKTLADKPDHFLYLNNGVTVLCHKIDPKSTKADRKRLDIQGFSVVNGAQTIASAAKFVADNPTSSIQAARVSITVIQADSDDHFGKSVTRARNHQNPVLLANFAALDDEQERLRRDLALLGIHYAYKAGAADGVPVDLLIRADEATQALALFHRDPRYVVWLKKEPSTLLDTSSERYKGLFTPQLSAYQLANAVRFTRYVTARMSAEAKGVGPERLTYKHGVFAFGWALAKRIEAARSDTKLFELANLNTALSAPADELRHALWDKTQLSLGNRSPLGVFRSQVHALPVLAEMLVQNYGLSADPAVAALKARQDPSLLYPVRLFEYLVDKAPQIGNLG